MKELFEQVIQRREYDLKSLLTCIDQYHIEGKLTDDERQELVSLLIVVRRASSMRAASSFLFIIPLPYFNNDNTDLGQYLLSADESTSAYTLYLKSASYWTCGSK